MTTLSHRHPNPTLGGPFANKQVRYSLIITPVNYSLAAVNFFVGSTGLAQLVRIWDWRRKNPVQAKVEDKVFAK